jgi:hypothetical protein
MLTKGWTFMDFDLRYPEQKTNDKEELQLMFWNEEDKTQADFHISWEYLGELALQLHAFDDSWKAIYVYGQEFLKFLSELGNSGMTKKEFKKKLIELGFKDETFERQH